MKRWAGFCFLIIGGITASGEVVVTAEGRYSANTPTAREIALADALREAVRIGAGVNIASQTKASDLNLEYDRVFEAAFGYVKDYKVISSGMGKDGFYHVTVSAHVDRGNPDKNDIVALKQLVALHHSPRIIFDIKDDISFVPKNSGFANEWFIDEAKNFQLNVVSLENLDVFRSNAPFNGVSKSDRAPEIKADYLVKGMVKGKYEITDIGSSSAFALNADLQVIVPQTGEVIATTLINPSESIKTDIASPQIAARNAVFCMFRSKKGNNDSEGDAIFRKLLLRWSSELDLGHVVRVEFIKIEASEMKHVEEKLKNEPHISGVWGREFNDKSNSYIDLETRLDCSELSKAITEASDGAFGIKHADENYLIFVKGGSGSYNKNLWSWLKKLWG